MLPFLSRDIEALNFFILLSFLEIFLRNFLGKFSEEFSFVVFSGSVSDLLKEFDASIVWDSIDFFIFPRKFGFFFFLLLKIWGFFLFCLIGFFVIIQWKVVAGELRFTIRC